MLKALNMTAAEAASIDGGDEREARAVMTALRARAAAMRTDSTDTVEIYHPEGWVQDVVQD